MLEIGTRGGPGGGGAGYRRTPPDSGRPPDRADGQNERRQRDPALEDEPPNRLEVMGSKKEDVRSLVADKAPGIAVKIGQVEGRSCTN